VCQHTTSVSPPPSKPTNSTSSRAVPRARGSASLDNGSYSILETASYTTSSASPRNSDPRYCLSRTSPVSPRSPAVTVLREIGNAFDAAGYDVDIAELLAAQYGVPQMRWRVFFVGWRRDLASNGGFPRPTHGRWGIGDLVPNRTVTPEAATGFLTVRDAIGDLPPVDAGCTTREYDSPPDGPYQQAMRLGAPDELHNHYAARLAPQNIDRIERLSPGDDWRALPTELLPPGMQRALRKDHTRRYRRMQWTGVWSASTISFAGDN